MKILIASGGTRVPIDDVRRIENMSTGNFGQKIAFECLKQGHQVYFLRARGSKSPFSKEFDLTEGHDVGNFTTWYNERQHFLQDTETYREDEYFTFDDYQIRLESTLANWKPDVVVLAAAVSDYGVENYHAGKIRSGNSMTINLAALPKIISTIKKNHARVKLVGFKMLVNSTDIELINAAQNSIEKNDCDMVVANDLRDIKNNNHRVFIVKKNSLPFLHRTDVNNQNHIPHEVVKAIGTL